MYECNDSERWARRLPTFYAFSQREGNDGKNWKNKLLKTLHVGYLHAPDLARWHGFLVCSGLTEAMANGNGSACLEDWPHEQFVSTVLDAQVCNYADAKH